MGGIVIAEIELLRASHNAINNIIISIDITFTATIKKYVQNITKLSLQKQQNIFPKKHRVFRFINFFYSRKCEKSISKMNIHSDKLWRS